jgi:hypothetical protein
MTTNASNPVDAANPWPAYAQAFHDSNLLSRRRARPRQRWLILFSLGGFARSYADEAFPRFAARIAMVLVSLFRFRLRPPFRLRPSVRLRSRGFPSIAPLRVPLAQRAGRFCSRSEESFGSMLGMQRRPFSSAAFAPRFPCTQRPPPNQTLELTASRRTTLFLWLQPIHPLPRASSLAAAQLCFVRPIA